MNSKTMSEIDAQNLERISSGMNILDIFFLICPLYESYLHTQEKTTAEVCWIIAKCYYVFTTLANESYAVSKLCLCHKNYEIQLLE